MTTNFNMQRLLSVARWDLTINKTFYSKAVMLILGCALLPVVMPNVMQLAQQGFVFSFGGDTMFPEEEALALAAMSSFISFLYFLIIVGAAGYTFHNLRYRQGRIMELTLPASNLERFLWHNLLVFIGTQVAIVLSALLADAAHVLLAWAVQGKTEFHSLSLNIFNSIYTPLTDFAGESSVGFLLRPLPFLWAWNFIYTFSLFNAWKYRYNIGYTLLFHILWWITIVILISVGVAVLVLILVEEPTSIDATLGIDAGNLLCMLDLSPCVIHTAAFLFTVSITCLLIWITFRLYCRAQITSSRNP